MENKYKEIMDAEQRREDRRRMFFGFFFAGLCTIGAGILIVWIIMNGPTK